MIDETKIIAIYDFLRSKDIPVQDVPRVDGTVVFGRSDPLVAQKAGEFYKLQRTPDNERLTLSLGHSTPASPYLQLQQSPAISRFDFLQGHLTAAAPYLLMTGGIGKDSGILARLKIPEAHFQGALANVMYGVPEAALHYEVDSLNGGDSCRNSIAIMQQKQLPHDQLAHIIHATSAMRLSALFAFEAKKVGFESTNYLIATNYQFKRWDLVDQKECVAELLRLADWPAKGWLLPQDVPQELVEYARHADALFKAG